MMRWQPISVTNLSSFSRSLLVSSPQAVVTGTTSHGVFIRLSTDWVLFLTFETFRGPLTLNLSKGKTTPRSVEVDQTIVIQDEKILIPSAGIEIDFGRAEMWESLPKPDSLLSASDRSGSLIAAARHIFSHCRDQGLYLVLKDILEIELDDLPLPPRPFEGVTFVRLRQLLKTTSDLEEIFKGISPLLGSGAGLTPSGDDLILGLLLAYRRWETILKPAFDLEGLNGLLNQAASQKTTLLSANLIACASFGQADERLINALDGIMTGNLAPEQCANALMSWGNSSGRDALVGMALAILSASG